MRAHRIVRVTLAGILGSLLLSGSARAAEEAAQKAAKPPTGVKEMLMWIEDAETKLEELSRAMPEDKYSWRPAEGVRSVAETYMHVAAANYGVPTFIGVKPPEGFDFMSYEKSLTKKDDIVKALEGSFDHLKGALKSASEADLDKPATFFGMQTTGRGAYLLLLSHAHEHLGQSIAYARMNAVAPPWTARQQAEMAKQKGASTTAK